MCMRMCMYVGYVLYVQYTRICTIPRYQGYLYLGVRMGTVYVYVGYVLYIGMHLRIRTCTCRYGSMYCT